MDDIRSLALQALESCNANRFLLKKILKATEVALASPNKVESVEYDAWESGCMESTEWSEFVAHRIKVKHPLTTPNSVKRLLKRLKRLSKGNKEVAIKILQQSIDSGKWYGVFELNGN